MSASYLRAQWCADRHELEAQLLAGLHSPTSEMSIEEWSILRDIDSFAEP